MSDHDPDYEGIVSRWYGKPVSDRQRRFLEGHDITQDAAELEHRIEDHDWELAAAAGVKVTNEDLGDFFYLQKYHRLARAMIFESPHPRLRASQPRSLPDEHKTPPFASLKDAWEWIVQELSSPSAQEQFNRMQELRETHPW